MALVRKLPVSTPAAFSELMAGCSAGRWQRVPHEPFGEPRKTMGGVDLATNIPASTFLACHNEMLYNPHPCDVVVLACCEAAARGGESLMARNADYSAFVSRALQEFVRERGIRYTRYYVDGAAGRQHAPHVHASDGVISWQARCGLDEACADRDAAAAEFRRRLGPEVTLEWDAAGGVAVHTVMSGFNDDGDWCNVISSVQRSFRLGWTTAGDGGPLPEALVAALPEQEARAYRALLLEPGDVWLIDNMRAAHGRLPFEDGDGSKRTLFTHLANWVW